MTNINFTPPANVGGGAYANTINAALAGLDKDGANVLAPNFNADRTGVTEATTPIQDAIDAVASRGGGKVRVPDGVYTCQTLIARSNVLLDLDPGAILKLKNNTATTPGGPHAGGSSYLFREEDDAIPIDNFHIRGGTIDCNFVGQTTYSGGILLNAPLDRVSVQQVTFLNAYEHALFFTEPDNGSTGTKLVRDCAIDGFGLASGVIGFGLYVDYCPYTTFERNLLKNGDDNLDDAIEIAHSPFCEALSNRLETGQLQFPFSDDCLIAFNTLTGTDAVTIQNDNNTANRARIIGNYVKTTPQATYAAISVVGDLPVISNNYVELAGDKGIRVIGAGAVINGNSLYATGTAAVGRAGIYCEGNYPNSRIVGNIVRGTGWHTGVLFEGSNIGVIGNFIDVGATGYGIRADSIAGLGRTLASCVVAQNDFGTAATRIEINDQPVLLSENVGVNSGAGSPEGVVKGVKGMRFNNITDAEWYIFRGTNGANTGWKLITHA